MFSCSRGSENAIRHLASVEHVNKLKHFFWKYGGTVDQLDVFTVSDNDVAKVPYILCLFFRGFYFILFYFLKNSLYIIECICSSFVISL
jgi:hypothetical protein